MRIHFHTNETTIQDAVHAFVREWHSDLSYFEVATSGSTGTPKIIRIEKKYARTSAETTCTFLGLKPGQQALLCLSPETIAGKMMIVRSIVSDMDLHVVQPSAQPFESIRESIDFVAVVPYQLLNIVEKAPEALSGALKVIVGGGPVSPSLEVQLSGFSASIYHTFGMTETISHIAMRDLKAPRSPFKTMPGVTVQTEEDCLVIAAPHLGINSLRTNDCIEWIDSNTFKWIGRSDFVINSGGIKIHPEQVEKALAPLIQTPFFIAGVPDEALGEKAVLCIEASSEFPSKEVLQQHLSPYHLPKATYVFTSFSRTNSGKVNRIVTLKEQAFDEKPIL